MQCLSSFRRVLTAAWIGLITTTGAVCTIPQIVQAQETQNRVMWQLDFAKTLNAEQKSLVQSTMMNTLSRAKERHFVGDNIMANKIKKEGLNFPECFTEGQPCSAGGAFVLDVHNVDAYVKATFSFQNKQWIIDLKSYRSLSASAIEIHQSGASLPDLIQTVVSSLFELEAGVEITSALPDVEIYINQKLVGTTPMVMKLPAGAQSMTFKKNGYVSETWEFNAEKGKVYHKALDLRPEETQLTVLTTAPNAEIWVDGQYWAKSDETQNILPGEHQIEVRSDMHQSYQQTYKVYPGSPQTMHVALLPHSENPYDIRHRGIKKYRLSASVGYHFGGGQLGMKRSGSGVYQTVFDNNRPTVFFHGVSMAFNYEAEYWGVTFLRLDIGGATGDGKKSILGTIQGGENQQFVIQEGIFVGVYPAQIRGHYTFWVMQAEATFGLGLSYIRMATLDSNQQNVDWNRVKFSLNFNLGLKYFFSEETFAMLSYDLQYDVDDNSGPRHGMTLGVGMQIPAWMRSDEVPELESELLSEDEAAGPNENAVIESAIDELSQTAAEASREINGNHAMVSPISVDAVEVTP